MIALGVLGIALAQDPEHRPPSVSRVEVEHGSIPPGPARTVTIAPGEDAQAALRGLPAGSTLELAAGEHAGPLVVDRPARIVGQPGAVLRGQGRGSVIVVDADDVTVSGLRVTGSGRDAVQGDAGVLATGARLRLLHLEIDDVLAAVDLRMTQGAAVLGCRIVGQPVPLGRRGDAIRVWESDGVILAGNRVEGARDIIIWYSDDVTIAGNSVSSSRYGTHLMYAHDVRIVGNRYADDVVGVFSMYSRAVTIVGSSVVGSSGQAGMGLGFKEADDVAVVRNRIGTSTTGIYLDSSPQRPDSFARFEQNVVAYNGTAVRLHNPAQANVSFAGNSFWENGLAAGVDGGGSVGEARFEGNWWSEYAGYDLDEDGLGDVPFALRTTSGDLRQRDPAVAFFSGTLAMALLDSIGAAFPLFTPKQTLSDPAPRFDPLLP